MTTKTATQQQDRVYKLIGQSPLSYVLGTRDTKRFRLQYYDPETKTRRTLRYATNFPTPFLDEQHGEAILEDTIFENGMLVVPYTNPALQQLLSLYHPGNGTVFKEVDYAKDAEEEMVNIDLEGEAWLKAKSMDVKQAEHMYRVIFGKDPSLVTSSIIYRDIKVHAKRNPKDFLEKSEDPALTIQSEIRLLFDRRFLTLRNNNRDIHWNLKDNKTRLLSVPMGENPYREAQAFFETETGKESFAILKKMSDELFE